MRDPTAPFPPTDLHGTAPNVNILKNDKKITKSACNPIDIW